MHGYLPYASNATLLVTVESGDERALAVYKPRKGESPLWDFPDGTLCLREYAAWLVDGALGWGLVPPTVLREGPAGFGCVQWFVEVDPEFDLRDLLKTHPDDLRRLAAFDVVVNNADRKGGHCLVDAAGKLWGVDHGVTFHAEPKLRTIVWAFQGEPLPDDTLSDLEGLAARLRAAAGPLRAKLGQLLDPRELMTLVQRLEGLIAAGVFPVPGPGRHIPWPPW